MIINVKSLKAAILCVADDREIRKYLCDVFVDGKAIVATNSHIAYIDRTNDNINLSDDQLVKTRIPTSILSGFLKLLDKDTNYIDITTSIDADGNQIARLSVNDKQELVSTGFKVETYYINYDQSFSTKHNYQDTGSIRVNLDYINILNKINKLIRRNKAVSPLLNFNGDRGVIVAEWTSHPNINFYVMPMA